MARNALLGLFFALVTLATSACERPSACVLFEEHCASARSELGSHPDFGSTIGALCEDATELSDEDTCLTNNLALGSDVAELRGSDGAE